MLRVLVLGAAAGGGFPQWNSNSDACRRARLGDADAPAATQASIAISADDEHWFLVNASPDLREQVNREQTLHPRSGLRSSPISGVVLTNGDVDAVAGLLHLRERTPFVIYAHKRVLNVLDQNSIFRVLAPDVVSRVPLSTGEKFVLCGADGQDAGLRLECFTVPGKVALYLEDESCGESLGTRQGDTLGLEFSCPKNDSRVVYIANCAAVDDTVRDRARGASVLFFDGTFWRDDEMIRSGEGAKTGTRMGHISISGTGGTIAAFSGVDVGRRILIHINNTNPVLLTDSPERRIVESKNWEIAYDGMEINLP